MPKHLAYDTRLRNEIVRHMIRSVEQSRPDDSPTPHAIVEEFFPTSVYEQLLDGLPAADAYHPMGYDGSTDDPNRFRFALDNVSLESLDPEQRNVWLAARGALASEGLRLAIYQKLSGGLSHRFGWGADEVPDRAPGYAKPELYRELSGYTIKPHPDTRRKVVTMQVCLSRDDSQRALGTEFYRRNLSPAAWLREPRGFDVVKTAPFVANTAMAFVVLNTISKRSWHGRSHFPEELGVRNSILNIWYAQPEDGNPDVQAEQRLAAAA